MCLKCLLKEGDQDQAKSLCFKTKRHQHAIELSDFSENILQDHRDSGCTKTLRLLALFETTTKESVAPETFPQQALPTHRVTALRVQKEGKSPDFITQFHPAPVAWARCRLPVRARVHSTMQHWQQYAIHSNRGSWEVRRPWVYVLGKTCLARAR